MKLVSQYLKKELYFIILFISLIGCKTDNKVDFEFYTSNISICRLNIYNSLDSLQAKVIKDTKIKISKRLRRNEITLNINEQKIDKLIHSIQHECDISCKKILKQSDLSTALKGKNVELKLLIIYSK